MEGKIKDWLKDQGYPLEFQVANELRKNRFNVIQSDYYTDPETGESREMDVIGHIQKKIGEVLFRITIIIECKAGKDKPWMLFSSPDAKLTEIAKIAQTPSTVLGRDFLSLLAKSKKYQEMSLFSLGVRSSFGITQCFTSGKDIPYRAIKCVAKATDAKCKHESEYRSHPICDIMLPFVVIQAPLYESYYEEKIILNKIDSGTMTWRNNLISMPHSIIKIQQFKSFKAKLPKYVEEIETIINDAENDGLLKQAHSKYDSKNPYFVF